MELKSNNNNNDSRQREREREHGWSLKVWKTDKDRD